MSKRKTYLEQMGLEPVGKLNKQICRQRVSHLKKGIKGHKFTGRLLKQAKDYIAWYGWMAKHGGSRSADA